MSKIVCSFCEEPKQKTNKLIEGINGYICNECVDKCYELIHDAIEHNEEQSIAELPKPQQIKDHLDQYVVGQDRAKIGLSVAVYNHYKRILNPTVDGIEIDKSNQLIIGPSGTGKTFLLQTISRMLNVPFVIIDSTTITEAGYVGDDADSIISRLFQASGNNLERTQKGIIYIDEIDKKARRENSNASGRDVSGEGVQQALLKLLEGTEVIIAANGNKRMPTAELIKVDTRDILFIVGGAFVGLDKIVEKRLNKSATVGFGAHIKDPNTIDPNIVQNVEVEDLIQYGLIPEFIGRIPNVIVLDDLTSDQLVKILIEPKHALVKQYKVMFGLDGVELEFEQEALESIAKIAKDRKTGARGLRSIIEKHLIDIQFKLPNMKDNGISKVVITAGTITNNNEPKYA